MMGKVFSDLFTGPDGKTVAIGRLYSAPVLVSGLVTPFIMLWKGQQIDLTALGVMYGGLGAAVMALVSGTNATEPKADS
ncbi:hypothetical protein [Caulobacter segnis]